MGNESGIITYTMNQNNCSILTSTEIIESEEKLAQIHQCLFQEKNKLPNDPTLFSGFMGIALFLMYYSRYKNNQETLQYGIELISKTVDTLAQDIHYPGFAKGLAGVGWTIEHLVQHEFFEADTNDILAELDSLLLESIPSFFNRNNYFFLDGAGGLGLYFLSRHKTNPLTSLNAINLLLSGLEQKCLREQKEYLKWLSPKEPGAMPTGTHFNMAHGMAGLIALLSCLKALDVFPQRVSRLLTGATNYLLTQQMERNHAISIFPQCQFPEEPVKGSKMDWGTGDPGMASALWQAGHIMNEKQWEVKALDILIHSCGRRNVIDENIINSGLGRGAAGLAQIFHYMFRQTGLDIFNETARYWTHAVVGMGYHPEGFAGYRVWRGEKKIWQREAGLFEGIAGIGLALISALSPQNSAWEQCLLLY